MTEVFSSIFGRKKPKGPAPAPLPAASPTPQDDFVMVGHAPGYPINAQTPYPTQAQAQSGEYESLFSFLRVQSPGDANNGANRPARPAPPVPATFNYSNLSYGINPKTSGTISASESQTTAFYVSGVPFQISKTMGGGISVHQMQSELNDLISRVKAPNLVEYDYTFELEEQILREISADKNSFIQR